MKDKVIETTFPNIQRLLKIYICTPQAEAVVEDEDELNSNKKTNDAWWYIGCVNETFL